MLIQQKPAEKYLNDYSTKLVSKNNSPLNQFRPLLETLKWVNHYDEYYTIGDLKKMEIVWSFGFEKHLGYADNTILHKSLYFVDSLNHPFIQYFDTLYNAGVLSLIEGGLIKTDTLKTRYIVDLPVRKSNGSYVLVKRMTLPLSSDAKGMVLTIMNCYTIVGSYRGQPLRPRFFQGSSGHMSNNELYKLAAQFVPNGGVKFTTRHLEYIDEFISVYTKIDNQTTNYNVIVAKNLGMKLATLRVTEKEIRSRMCLLFGYPNFYKKHRDSHGSKNFLSCLPNFDSFKEGIYFLHKSGILSIFKNISLKPIAAKNF